MTEKKVNWDDIPSLDGLEVDWQFEPENPLGKRAWVRIAKSDLLPLLDAKNIPVKVVAKDINENGYLVDIAQSGLAVLLQPKLAVNQLVKVGLILGKQKIISRAIVRNVRAEFGKHRTGMEFVELPQESKSFIVGLIASKIYSST
jgi:PilZ domain